MNPRQRRHLKYSLNCSYLINFQLVHHSRLRKKSKQNPASSPPPPGHYIKIIIFYKIRLYKQGTSFFCLVSLDNNYDKKSLIFQLRQDGDCSGRAGSRRSIHRKIGAIRRGGKRRAHGPSAGCPSVGVGRQQKLIIWYRPTKHSLPLTKLTKLSYEWKVEWFCIGEKMDSP